MQEQTGSKLSTLIDILTYNTLIPTKLFSYLTISDLLQLTCISKKLNQRLEGNQIIINKIFYLRCLEFDRIMYTDYTKQGNNQQQQTITMQNILNNTVFTELAKQKKNIHFLLDRNLQLLSAKINKSEFVISLSKSLSNPDYPIPKLMRQTIGDFCNTNYQLFLASLSNKSQTSNGFNQFYELKKCLFENSQTFVNQFLNEGQFEIIKQIHYRPENIRALHQSQHPFVNVIQLIIISLKIQIEAASKYLEIMMKTSNHLDFFVEYCRRYELFRNTILDMEEKVGFLFEYFDETFNFCFPYLLKIQNYSLWKIGSKMWIQRTLQLRQVCNKICITLCLRLRQIQTQSFIDQQLTKGNLGIIISQIRMNNHCSIQFQPLSKIFQYQHEFIIPDLIDSDQIGLLTSSYIEGIVDLSLNQYNVHWCGSTDIQMNEPYQSFQQCLKQVNVQYVAKLIRNYGNYTIVRSILINEIDKMQASSIKPSSIKRIVQDINTMMQNRFNNSQDSSSLIPFSSILLSQQIKINTQKINRLNNLRNLIQFPPISQQIFYTGETLSDSKINDLVKQQYYSKSSAFTSSTINQTQSSILEQQFQKQHEEQMQIEEFLEIQLSKSYSYE